jgi:adenylate cyclase
MNLEPNGELIPVGGGDSIPLVRPVLSIGRRESCDITLNFPNISGLHCELQFRDGCWVVRDLNSTNGVKVNGKKVQKKVLQPGDTIGIAKRKFTIEYSAGIGNHALDEILEENEEIADIPLLEKAGLVRRRNDKPVPGSVRRPSIWMTTTTIERLVANSTVTLRSTPPPTPRPHIRVSRILLKVSGSRRP